MKHFTFTIVVLLSLFTAKSQSFINVPTSGYNLDAVAENTTATSTTGGAIDGSNYVLYSAAYGAIYNVNTGLPNNGVITGGTYSFQLQPYTQNNVLYLLAGQSGVITLNTPASYAGLSLLGFATEGNATFTVNVYFTDNTATSYTSLSFLDWFGTGTSIYSGFDRATRSTGNTANLIGNPKMYTLDMPLICADRAKQVQSLSIQNTSSNARVVLMAVSGAAAPNFSSTSLPVTCTGGKNGSAMITGVSGIPPYTYTWSTVPVQNSAQAVNLPVGVYTYSVQDNMGCVQVSTIAVTQSLSPEPTLTLSSNAYTVCAGNTFTLGAQGASTYTWQGGTNGSLYSPPSQSPSTPTVITYTVQGLTTVNCLRTGSLNITVNPLPAASFISSLTPICRNSTPILLNTLVSQLGGTFSGPGVSSGSFVPTVSVGTYTISFTKTDNNGCSRTATTSVVVSSLAIPSIVTPPAVCANTATLQLSGSPQGGTFGGTGTNGAGLFNGLSLGAGNYVASYTTVAGPCTTYTTVNILVNAIPVTSIITTKFSFCKTAGSIVLNAIPTGGLFSGPGMTGPTFAPSKANVGANKILYIYTDGNGCTDTSAITMTINECIGIDEKSILFSNISVFPNPATGAFTIKGTNRSVLTIVNEIGQLIRTAVLTEETAYTSEITDLAPGIYFIVSQNSSSRLKIVVLK